jgi:spectinomycin phosphotransferase
MENETAIGEESLIRTIQEDYRLEVTNLDFHQSGWGGNCYTVETLTGSRYFLKVVDQVTNIGVAVSSLDFYLDLMDQLHTKGILPHIPHPIPTQNGSLASRIDSFALVLTNYIIGEDVGFGNMSKPVLIQLADRAGILHNCRSQLAFEHPFIEQFETGFVLALLEIMEGLETIGKADPPGQQLLRGVLLPRKEDLFRYLERLKRLQAEVRSSEVNVVICHTDLHGGNLMTDDQGNLYILDWENAMIAPREHDMIFFAGESNLWEIFWPIYQRHFDRVELDFEVLRFYFYRRGLEDVAGYVFRIEQGDGGEDRDQSDVEGVLECLDELSNVEATLSSVREISNLG